MLELRLFISFLRGRTSPFISPVQPYHLHTCSITRLIIHVLCHYLPKHTQGLRSLLGTVNKIPNRLSWQHKKFKKINKKLATRAISTGHHEKNMISPLKSKLKKFQEEMRSNQINCQCAIQEACQQLKKNWHGHGEV